MRVFADADGHVRVWDVRNKKPVANIPAHTNEKGSGAVLNVRREQTCVALLCFHSLFDNSK